jgi:hypothetical protein
MSGYKNVTLDSIVKTLNNCNIPVNDKTLGIAVTAYISSETNKDEQQFVKELTHKLKQTPLDIHHVVGKDLDLLKHINDDCLLKRLAINSSAFMQLPVNTVLIMGLAIFSSVACRRFKIKYRDFDAVPIGLYAIAEQPSGTGKSRCLSSFQKPFFEQYHEASVTRSHRIAKLIHAVENNTATDFEIEELDKLKNNPLPNLFTTNATAEGLERILPMNHGCFSAVSSEQGLFNSLFGKTYSNGVSNNDLILNGFDGGKITVSRVTREGFSGSVVGSVVCFAQQGSIDLVVEDSNGSGLSERFIMLNEPHRLGLRDHEKTFFIDYELLEEYKKVCADYKEVFESPCRFEELSELTISANGHDLIAKYRNELEPHLADGKKLSNSTLRGAVSKIDIQIMKIAANLHLINGNWFKNELEDDLIKTAIKIANDLLFIQVEILNAKGVIGIKAEYESILSYLSANKYKTEREIIMSRKCVKPFKSYSGGVSDLIRSTIQEMVADGLIIQGIQDGTKIVYSVA